MSTHLLLVTLGPVQDFIAQARRTRDLWHGSHLISELSRAAARALAEAGAELLISAFDRGDLALEPCWTTLRPQTGQPPEAIANKIWALVPASADPQALAAGARAAAKACLRDHAAAVWASMDSLLDPAVEPVWNEQVDDVLEFLAGWIPLNGRAFVDARAELDDALAARKRLRDFRPWRHGRPGADKSSLDGARESVLLPRRGQRQALAARLRLGEGEKLDAIGVIKRAGAKPERFMPLTNIALGPWIRLAALAHGPQLEACRQACAALGLGRLESPAAVDFPYEASLLMPPRWPAVAKELGIDVHDPRWPALRSAVLRLRRAAKLGDDDEPYVACLVADGDRMGDAINRSTTGDRLRRFSAELSRFAGEARELVAAHGGSLVYAGGDDVLAFLPVTTALECADALRRRFAAIVGTICDQLGLVDEDHPAPSLSVGVGIGHYLESMGELLALGREAEAEAKGGHLPKPEQRDALAVIVDKRSGGRRGWRRRWSQDLLPALAADQELLERLSIGKLHAIEATLQRLPTASDAEVDGDLSRVLRGELGRALSRNEGEPLSLAQARLLTSEDAELPQSYLACRAAVEAWIDRLLIAREIQRAAVTVSTSADNREREERSHVQS